MQLIDIGVNLTHESFGHDLPDVLHRASKCGVNRMIVTGTSVESTLAALALHAQHPHRLFGTAGLHPHHAGDFDPEVREQLRNLAMRPGIVAIGECGLDYYRDLAPRDAQRQAFAAQLELAVELGLPVFLHQRDAHADFIAVLRDYLPRLRAAVAHCFTDQAAALDECLDAGLCIGITGWICDERRGRHLVPLVPRIPPDRLMIETDAPYLLPRSLRPPPPTRRNEPALLTEVARAVASARGMEVEQLAADTTRAAEQFFALPRAQE